MSVYCVLSTPVLHDTLPPVSCVLNTPVLPDSFPSVLLTPVFLLSKCLFGGVREQQPGSHQQQSLSLPVGALANTRLLFGPCALALLRALTFAEHAGTKSLVTLYCGVSCAQFHPVSVTFSATQLSWEPCLLSDLTSPLHSLSCYLKNPDQLVPSGYGLRTVTKPTKKM